MTRVLALFTLKLLLSRNDDLAQAILRQKEAIVTELCQHILDLSIAEDVQQRVTPGTLHLDDVGVGEMVAIERCLPVRRRMKERKHETAGLQYLMNT